MQRCACVSQLKIAVCEREKKKHKVIDSKLPLFCFLYFIVSYIIDVFVQINISNLNVFISFSRLLVIGILYIKLRKSIKRKFVFALIVTFILFALSYITHFSGLTYILETFSFLAVLLMLPYIRLDKKSITVLVLILYALAVILMIFAPHGKINHMLGIIKFNPNGSAFILFLTFVVALAMYISDKNKIHLLLLTLCVGFQLKFLSRSALLAIGTVVAIFIMYKLFSKIVRLNVFIMTAIFLIGGIALAYFYSVLFFNWVGKGQLTILGKDIFSGRQVIWQDAFNALKSNWLFGIGNTLNSWMIQGQAEVGTNLHNQMMGYLTIFGLPCTAAIIIVVSSLISFAHKNNRNILFICLVFGIIVISYFDTVIFSSINQPIIAVALVVIYSIKYSNKKHLSKVWRYERCMK